MRRVLSVSTYTIVGSQCIYLSDILSLFVGENLGLVEGVVAPVLIDGIGRGYGVRCR